MTFSVMLKYLLDFLNLYFLLLMCLFALFDCDIYRDAAVLKSASNWADRVLAEDAALAGEEFASLNKALSRHGINEVDFRSI